MKFRKGDRVAAALEMKPRSALGTGHVIRIRENTEGTVLAIHDYTTKQCKAYMVKFDGIDTQVMFLTDDDLKLPQIVVEQEDFVEVMFGNPRTKRFQQARTRLIDAWNG